jgi:MFS transporter, OPA family, glycerol-3-phosphate transporter
MTAPAPSDALTRSWQKRVFWLLWSAYASYYLCRVNFAVAQPEILREFPTWTSTQIGWIPSAYAAFYAAGQFLNALIGQRVGARKMMTVAMLVAAATNLAVSTTSSFTVMIALWSLNGFAQSAGWSLVVQTMSNWTTAARRGTVTGLLSTCYQFGNVASWLLAGQLCATLGWRAAFWVPSIVMLPVAAAFALLLRDSPQRAGLPPVRDDGVPAGETPDDEPEHLPLRRLLSLTLGNRMLWVIGLGYLCMNAVRYAFMNWSVQYMAEYQGRSIKGSAFTAVAIPLLGSLGAVTAGWVSDEWFGRRRAPVCALMLAGLAAVCAAFVYMPQGWWLPSTALLGLAGFLVFGPDMLMSGAASVDASHPKATASATGMIMCLGATGSIFSGAGVGWLKDAAHGRWSVVFWVLAAFALVSAALMASIWNARPRSAR